MLLFCFRHYWRSTYFILFTSVGFAQDQADSLPSSYIDHIGAEQAYQCNFEYGPSAIGGVMILKKRTDGMAAVLISKFGASLFSLTHDYYGETTWNQMIKPMEDRLVRNAVERAFRTIFLWDLNEQKKVKYLGENRYKVKGKKKLEVTLDSGRVVKVLQKGFLGIVKSRLFLSYTDGNVPDHLVYTAKNGKIRIVLTELVREK